MVMDLLVRSPTEEDLPACAQVMDDAFVYQADERGQLLSMWRKLLREKSVVTALVEDPQRPRATRILGFGMGVFVTDEFAQEAQTSLPPYLSQQVLWRWQSGRSPVLSLSEIRAANRQGGLNWLNLHATSIGRCAPGYEVEQMRDKLLRALFQELAGYQLKTATQEGHGPEMRQVMETFGLQLYNEPGDFFARASHAAPLAKQWPYLFSITREAACDGQHEGAYVRALFTYAPPHFAFHPIEQELLIEALSDSTDREIAAKLRRSTDTIKKQWLRIYEKVLSTDSEFFAAATNQNGDTPTRGLEKKRVLLKYLRRHPEELRPH